MLRVIVSASLVWACTGFSWAGDPPKGPPPRVVLAQVDKEGRAYVVDVVVETREEQRVVKVLINGREVERKEVVPVTVMREVRHSLDGPGVEVQDTNGKRVDMKKLRLAGPTPVLVSVNGNPVDPIYLRLVREGTLIVVRLGIRPNDLPPPREVPPPKE